MITVCETLVDESFEVAGGRPEAMVDCGPGTGAGCWVLSSFFFCDNCL